MSSKSTRKSAISLLAIVAVVSIVIQFLGWQLYDYLAIWQSIPNYDYQNILLLAIAVTSILILFGSGFIDALSGDLTFKAAKQLCLVIYLDVAVWVLGWLIYTNLQLWNGIRNFVFGGGTIAIAIVISVAILVLKPDIIRNLRRTRQ